MSLDVSLVIGDYCPHCQRESSEVVYDANITHNLNRMAEAAGIYTHVWRPEELEIKKAKELIEPLEKGINELKSKPQYYRTFNSSNGWGLYENFIPWLEKYLEACKENPEANIRVWR
jgi:hypothetical protein